MRIVLITQGVSRVVFPLLQSNHEVIGVIEAAPRKKTEVGVFHGLLKIVYGLFKKSKSLRSLRKKYEFKYCYLEKHNVPDVIEWVKRLSPDLMIVHSMSQLLKPELFNIPRYGTVNLHASYLPEYRGPNPDLWQYYDMVLEPGVTVHFIDEGEDTGDIILQERVEIELGLKSPDRLNLLVGKVGVRLLLKALDLIETEQVHRIPQPVESPTMRARNLKQSEHANIIDWESWPTERVWHVLRGTELWLRALPISECLFYATRWEVGGFDKLTSKYGVLNPGSIGEYKGKTCVGTVDGVIYLKQKFDLKKFVLGVLTRGK